MPRRVYSMVPSLMDGLALHYDFRNATLRPRVGNVELATPAMASASTRSYRGLDDDDNVRLLYAGSNQPRFQHDENGTCLGYLTERGRTEGCKRTEHIGGTDWTTSNVTVNLDDEECPSGDVFASEIIDASAVAAGYVQSPTFAQGGTYTIGSVFVKRDAAATHTAALEWVPAIGTPERVVFDYLGESGSIDGSAGVFDWAVEPFNDEWFRVWFSVPNGGSGNANLRIYPAWQINYSQSMTADVAATGAGHFWGCNVIAGSSGHQPTSYITNDTGINLVTTDDVLSLEPIPGGIWTPDTNGATIVAVFYVPDDGMSSAVKYVARLDNNTGDVMHNTIRMNAAGIQEVRANSRTGNTDVATFTTAVLGSAGSRRKVGFGLKQNDYNYRPHGAAVQTDVSGVFLSSFTPYLFIGCDRGGAPAPLDQVIEQILLFRRKLTDAELIAVMDALG